MELLPVELRKTLPPLYSQESCPTPIAHVKLFTPDSSFTWFVTEGAEQEAGDWLLFGFVIGLEEEWGYSLLSELATVRGPAVLPSDGLVGCFGHGVVRVDAVFGPRVKADWTSSAPPSHPMRMPTARFPTS